MRTPVSSQCSCRIHEANRHADLKENLSKLRVELDNANSDRDALGKAVEELQMGRLARHRGNTFGVIGAEMRSFSSSSSNLRHSNSEYDDVPRRSSGH